MAKSCDFRAGFLTGDRLVRKPALKLRDFAIFSLGILPTQLEGTIREACDETQSAHFQ
jgi:hypothetical protein